MLSEISQIESNTVCYYLYVEISSNTKSPYKVHVACDRLLPMLALGSGLGVVLCRSPQGHLGQERGDTKPSQSFRPLDTPSHFQSTGKGPACQGK